MGAGYTGSIEVVAGTKGFQAATAQVAALEAQLKATQGQIANLGGAGGSQAATFSERIRKHQLQLRMFGHDMQLVGQTIFRWVTLPLGVVSIVTAKMAYDFNTAMTKIQALTGATTKDMKLYNAAVLELSKTTGVMPTDIAEGLYFIASSGFKGAEALKILNQAVKLTASGMGEMRWVSETLTSAMTAWGKHTLSAASAADTLVAAVREGKAEPDEFARSLGRVIPVAAQIGIKFAEVGAAIASVTRIGMSARISTFGLRTLLTSFTKPQKPLIDGLKAIGLTVQGVFKDMTTKGFLPAMREIYTAAHGNVKKITQMFTQNGATIFLALMRDYKGTQGVFERLTKRSGDAQRAFIITMKSPAAQFRVALAGLSAAAIELGAKLLPIFTKIVVWIKGLVEWFNGLSEGTQAAIGKILLAAAAVGLFASAIGKASTILTGTNALVMLLFGGGGQVGIWSKLTSGSKAAATALETTALEAQVGALTADLAAAQGAAAAQLELAAAQGTAATAITASTEAETAYAAAQARGVAAGQAAVAVRTAAAEAAVVEAAATQKVNDALAASLGGKAAKNPKYFAMENVRNLRLQQEAQAALTRTEMTAASVAASNLAVEEKMAAARAASVIGMGPYVAGVLAVGAAIVVLSLAWAAHQKATAKAAREKLFQPDWMETMLRGTVKTDFLARELKKVGFEKVVIDGIIYYNYTVKPVAKRGGSNLAEYWVSDVAKAELAAHKAVTSAYAKFTTHFLKVKADALAKVMAWAPGGTTPLAAFLGSGKDDPNALRQWIDFYTKELVNARVKLTRAMRSTGGKTPVDPLQVDLLKSQVTGLEGDLKRATDAWLLYQSKIAGINAIMNRPLEPIGPGKSMAQQYAARIKEAKKFLRDFEDALKTKPINLEVDFPRATYAGTVSKIKTLKAHIAELKASVTPKNKLVVEAEIRQAQRKLETLRDLRAALKDRKFKTTAIVGKAINDLSTVVGLLADLIDKTITVTVKKKFSGGGGGGGGGGGFGAGDERSPGAQSLGTSFVDSLTGYVDDAREAGRQLGLAGLAGIATSIQATSPSKRGLYYGLMLAEGFGLGIKKGTAKAVEAAASLAGNVLSVLESALGISAAIGSLKEQGLPTTKVATAWAKKVSTLLKAMIKAMQKAFRSIDIGKAIKGDKEGFGEKSAGWKAEAFASVVSMAESVGSILTTFSELTAQKIDASLVAIALVRAKAKKIGTAIAGLVKAILATLSKTIVSEFVAGSATRAIELASAIAGIIVTFAELTKGKIDEAVTQLEYLSQTTVLAPLVAAIRLVAIGMRDAFAKDRFSDIVLTAASAAMQLTNDIAGIITTFSEMTQIKIDEAIEQLIYLAQFSVIAPLALAIRNLAGAVNFVFRNESLNVVIDNAAKAAIELANNIAGVITNFAAMTADVVEKAKAGILLVVAAAPAIGDNLVLLVDALKTAFSKVADNKDFIKTGPIATKIAAFVSDVTGIVSSLAGMAIVPEVRDAENNVTTVGVNIIQNAIDGASLLASKANELGTALSRVVQGMVDAVKAALGVYDLKTITDLTPVLTELGNIASAISGIVSALATITSDQIDAATSGGAALGDGFLAGLTASSVNIYAKAREIVATTTAILAGAVAATTDGSKLNNAREMVGVVSGSTFRAVPVTAGNTNQVTNVNVNFSGDINAITPQIARASGQNIGAAVIEALAKAKRATSKGTP